MSVLETTLGAVRSPRARGGRRPTAGAAGWVLRTATATWRRAREAHLKRQTVAELRGLSNRQLKDIGLSRSEIFFRVYGPTPKSGRRSGGDG